MCNVNRTVDTRQSSYPGISVQSRVHFCMIHVLKTTIMWLYYRPQKQQGKSEGFDSCDRPRNLNLDSNRQFFRPCDREIWWMTSKNNRALLLYYIKLCASFQIYWWIQTGFTVQKRSIRVEIGDMLSRVTLKLDGWPWKTIVNRAPLLCYFKLCVAFSSHWWI